MKHMRMLMNLRIHAVLSVILVCGVMNEASLADLFEWTGDCGGNLWKAYCSSSYCDPPANHSPYYHNNWGRTACGPALPAFPEAGDDVVLIGNFVLLEESADVFGLALDAGSRLDLGGGAYTRTLSIHGTDVVNDGVIVVNSNQWYAHRLEFAQNADLSGTGEIILNHNSSNAALTSASGATVTQAAGHTIRGMGEITAPLVNEGLVRADVAEQAMLLRTAPKTNRGAASATSGATLHINGIPFNQEAAGQLIADGGTVRADNNAVLSGGMLVTTNGGVITLGNVELRDVTVAAGSWVGQWGWDSVSSLCGSAITNHGTMVLNYDDWYGATMNVADSLTLQGDGELILRGVLRTLNGSTLTIGAGQTVRGEGTIEARVANDGLIAADDSSTAMKLRGELKTNRATISATGGATLDVAGVTIVQEPGAQVLADGGTVKADLATVISGGSLVTTNGGAITIGAAELHNVSISEGSWVGQWGWNSVSTLSGDAITNDGTLVVNYDLWYDATMNVVENLVLQGQGELVLRGRLRTLNGAVLTIAAGQTVRGYGTMDASVVNHGEVVSDSAGRTLTISPQAAGFTNDGQIRVAGGCYMQLNTAGLFAQTDGQTKVNGTLTVSGAPLTLAGGSLAGGGSIQGAVVNTLGTVTPGDGIGVLHIQGTYAQQAGGALEVELGGAVAGSGHDVLAISGSASLDGGLRIVTADGFVPAVGQQFVILTASGVTGEVSIVDSDRPYAVAHNPTNVTITALALPGDFDEDGDVDLDDHAIFADCMAGPGTTPAPTIPGVTPVACVGAFDLDGADGDVDLGDWTAFTLGYGY